MAEFTVAAGLARGVMDFSATKGVAANALGERSGVDLRDVADQDNRIPLAKYRALLRAAKELSRDPAFALHFGEAVDLSEMSVVGLIGRAAQTMLEAFVQSASIGQSGERLYTFHRRKSAGRALDFVQNGDTTKIREEQVYA